MAIGDELSPRKKQILKAVIDAHIENGEPVGSKYLTASTDIGCSSATIRNEMAELEELGYLEHPHTSAGRVPTTLGYRFYVDGLMNDYALTTRDLSIINTLQQMKMSELDRILQTASKLTAAVTSYTGVAVKPRQKPQALQSSKSAPQGALPVRRALSTASAKYQRIPSLLPSTTEHVPLSSPSTSKK